LSQTVPVSVFVIARDEADRIGPVIAAVRDWVDEVIVVDSGSTDGTADVAAGLGARVVGSDWKGYGPQKRFAETLCRNTWLLNLDADEVVTPALAEEIREVFASGQPACDAYKIRIAEVFPGDTRPAPFAYHLAPVRLYRVDRGRYSESTVHDRVVLEPGTRVGRLTNAVHHFSTRSLSHQLAKLNRYSDMQVADATARGRRIGTVRLWLEFPLAFLKAYVLRRYLFRGAYGYAMAINYAFFRHIRLAKLHERQLLAERGPTHPPDHP
jgi:glycosyltransferase involved in cell wall biosynthesis